MTESLARACAAHPWRTLAAWVGAIVVAFACVALFLPGSLTTEGRVTNDPESLRAADLEAKRFPHKDATSEIVVVRSDRYTTDAPQFGQRLQAIVAAGRATGAVAFAEDPTGRRDLTSPDRHAVLIPLR